MSTDVSTPPSTRPATVIATCLLNSSLVTSIEEGERAVRHRFNEGFPGHDFAAWNAPMEAGRAEDVVSNVGRASRINVLLFIWDLWENPTTRPARPPIG